MGATDDDSHASKSRTAQDEHDRLMRERYDRELGHGGKMGPFSAFKRFIDDNLSTLTDGIRHFPSNMAELRANMQQEQRRQQEQEQDISRRWTGSSGSPDHIKMNVERMDPIVKAGCTEYAKSLLMSAAEMNSHVPLAKIAALYTDREAGSGLLDQLASPLLALGGTWYYMPETGDTLPTAANWTLTGSTARWLSLDWFKRSPYSPIRLEAHPDLQYDGTKWRAAFEDLMLATLDKPMSAPDNACYEWMRTEPGLNWVLDIQERGVLPPLLPRFYSDLNTRKQLQHTSILDLISESKATMGTERSFPWSDPLTQDVTEFVSEVATNDAVVYDLEPESLPKSELEMYEQDDLMDWQMQLAQLEQKNKQMLEEARQNQEAKQREQQGAYLSCEEDDGVENGQRGRYTLEDYQMQVMLLEQQNKERLLIARPEQEAMEANVEDEDADEDFDDEDEDDEDDENDGGRLANYYRRQAMLIQELQRRREEAGLVLTGNKEEDLEDAMEAFGDAVHNRDVAAATDVLDTWYWKYSSENAKELIAQGVLSAPEFPPGCFALVKEAVEKSKLGETINHEYWTQEMVRERFNSLYSFRVGDAEVRELIIRLVKARGAEPGELQQLGSHPLSEYYFMEPEELERHVEMWEAREQERRNLEVLVGERRAEPESVVGGGEGRRVDVLSALTTTQTMRLPDGTVTTKVVLKKRFADGREECCESVHTSNEVVEAALRRKEGEDVEADERKSKGKGKGWFWS